jgi:hypothetical protein
MTIAFSKIIIFLQICSLVREVHITGLPHPIQ